MKKLFFSLSFLVVLGSVILMTQGCRCLGGKNTCSKVVAELAPEWTNLFHRTSGWTGSDGIYAIPYSGCDAPGSAANTKTLFVFGDTFLGETDPVTRKRLPPVKLVQNTFAILDGAEPDPNAITFVYGPGADGSYDGAVFVPNTPFASTLDSPWYWMQDGLSLNGKIYFFPLLLEADMSKKPGWQFKVVGITRLSIPLGPDGPDFANHTQVGTHLFSRGTGWFDSFTLGAAMMPNTAHAGAPNPDGFIYIYGYNGFRRLIAARVLAEDFEDFSKWRYWDGGKWSTGIEDIAGITGPVSSELSVSALPDGRYILVYMVNRRDVVFRIADSPVGPFGPGKVIYRATESDAGQSIYTYNAKAHPNISRPGELLITYNVNTDDWDSHLKNGDIYRPRFLRLRLSDVIKLPSPPDSN